MPEMKITVCEVAPIFTNCYLIQNLETRELIAVDPGGSPQQIVSTINSLDGTLKAILLTHGHYDHILGLPGLLEKCPAPVYADFCEEEMLSDAHINMSDCFGKGVVVRPDRFLKDNEVVTEAGLNFRVLHTPGHTKGCCCFYFEEQKVLFSGDTLFRRSVGRTDLYGGNEKDILNSLHRLITELPDDTRVYPGHGPATLIEFEKRNNPFV